MSFVEDLAVFFNADTPGYVSATIGAASVVGLFDNGFGATFNIDGTKPSFRCIAADVTTVVRGTAITILSVAYTVANFGDAPVGEKLLLLEKV